MNSGSARPMNPSSEDTLAAASSSGLGRPVEAPSAGVRSVSASPDSAAASTAFQHSQTTSTLDEPGPGLLLEVRPDGDGYIVKDFVGLRYGHDTNVPQAIAMWAEDVQWLLSEPREKLGPPLLDEADRYRKALPNG